MFEFLKSGRRQELRETPLTDAQWETLDADVPMLRGLAPDKRERLAGLVQIFLAEKHFEGGRDFEVTGEMKLVIAAEACLLLVHRGEEVPYPDLVNVIVYESAWRTKKSQHMGGGVTLESEGANLGESWSIDTVILSWARVERDAKNGQDGHNVALHEFAHQLDAQDGSVDGAPDLPSRERYASWSRVFSEEFDALRASKRSDIDYYGAESPPEFFAVVTEQFFEKPQSLALNHPELFEELQNFYGLDPRELAQGAAKK
jgi:Mlc titration factor MtfA (ptsG expression regulator)